MSTLRIACFCPVIVGQRPELLANSIAAFERQTYPRELRRLFVLDDVGQLRPQTGDGWSIETVSRQSSLPHKYQELLRRVGDWADVYAVWDHDDVYLPSHLEAAALALGNQEDSWCHPERFYSSHRRDAKLGAHQRLEAWLHDGVLASESAAGRMHGSLVVSREALQTVGGWLGVMPRGIDRANWTVLCPGDRRADFDQRMLRALELLSSPRRPAAANPTYVYRWATIAYQHCSGLMRTPDDESWYDNHLARLGQGRPLPLLPPIVPAFDAESANLIQLWERNKI